jgi:hypothetical protein
LNEAIRGTSFAIAFCESPHQPGDPEVVMNGFIEYAAFAGAIIGSIGLALALEWFGLNGLFRLMPGRAHERMDDPAAAKK